MTRWTNSAGRTGFHAKNVPAPPSLAPAQGKVLGNGTRRTPAVNALVRVPDPLYN
jgi:hypothetical protein